jgi:hypothetical protein
MITTRFSQPTAFSLYLSSSSKYCSKHLTPSRNPTNSLVSLLVVCTLSIYFIMLTLEIRLFLSHFTRVSALLSNNTNPNESLSRSLLKIRSRAYLAKARRRWLPLEV